MALSGKAVLGVVAGGTLLYAGIKGKSIQSASRLLLSGTDPKAATPANQITGSKLAAGEASGGPIGGGDQSAHGANAALNQAKAKAMCVAYGWSVGANWRALVALWNQESGWNQYAQNPSSGAYGIPQALPPTKMPRLARKPYSLASVQIAWGLRYIKQRYGSPVKAWEHEQANNWY